MEIKSKSFDSLLGVVYAIQIIVWLGLGLLKDFGLLTLSENWDCLCHCGWEIPTHIIRVIYVGLISNLRSNMDTFSNSLICFSNPFERIVLMVKNQIGLP